MVVFTSASVFASAVLEEVNAIWFVETLGENEAFIARH
jgi:hypothetical protein